MKGSKSTVWIVLVDAPPRRMVSRGEKMLYSGTDPESSYITEFTLYKKISERFRAEAVKRAVWIKAPEP